MLNVLFAFYRFETEAERWAAARYPARATRRCGASALPAPAAALTGHGSAGCGSTERVVRVKETWRRFTPAQVRDFLRVGHEGRDHPSRLKTLELLSGMTSVLDVGCGTGVMFELSASAGPISTTSAST